MANTDRARKLLVRSALVTSTTIATFVGAQNLAMLDTQQVALLLTPSPAVVNVLKATEATPPQPIRSSAPTLVIQQAAPSIIVLRQSAQPGSSRQPTPISVPAPLILQQPASTQPPAPSVISAPAPVIIQQPVQQSSRSSR